MKGHKNKSVIKITESHNNTVEDAVAEEKKLRISVNGQEVLSLYCSPIMVRELVAGFIMTEGVIQGSWCADRMSIRYDEEIHVDIPAEGEVSLKGSSRTSGCVGGITFDNAPDNGEITEGITVGKEQLRELFHEFQARSDLYNLTGCIHSAAVSDGRCLLVVAEDIGRHNAVDKVIGYCFLEDIPLNDKIILVSGRLSSEMAAKCSRWGIPIVVSRAAPTALAIDISAKRGITMVGFMRGKRLNIYTHQERIIR